MRSNRHKAYAWRFLHCAIFAVTLVFIIVPAYVFKDIASILFFIAEGLTKAEKWAERKEEICKADHLDDLLEAVRNK